MADDLILDGGRFNPEWWVMDALILGRGVWWMVCSWMLHGGEFDTVWWMVDGLILDGGW